MRRRVPQSVYNVDNPYGYLINVNHPDVRPIYEQYRRELGYRFCDPMSDQDRRNFDAYYIYNASKQKALSRAND